MNHFIQSVCLFTRFSHQETLPIIQSIIKVCQNHGIKILIDDNTPNSSSFNLPTCSISTTSADYLIVVGGDGSMLQAAHQSDLRIPLLGINTGKLGFLADIYPDQVERSLKEIFNGQYITEKRNCLKWTTKNQSGFAINEVSVKSQNLSSISQFNMLINDEIIYEQAADGIIVATPTGSTAYSLSSGGSIVSPQLNCWLITPICAHRLNTRPLIISDGQKVSIQPISKPLSFSADSLHHLDLPLDDCIEMSKNSRKLELIHPKNYHYYRSLKNKLNWESQHANRC